MSRSRSLISQQRGSFSPVLEGMTTPGAHTYTALNLVRWQRIGSIVRCWGAVAMATRDPAMAGQLRVINFPFIANAANPPQHSQIIRNTGILPLDATFTYAILSMTGGAANGTLWQMAPANNMSALTAATATGVLAFNFSVEYEIA